MTLIATDSTVLPARIKSTTTDCTDLVFSKDVVIGAPYEDDRGAVYLYLGGPEGILRRSETVYWQRIAAADFASPPLDGLRGFGISLSVADFDNNLFPGKITLKMTMRNL